MKPRKAIPRVSAKRLKAHPELSRSGSTIARSGKGSKAKRSKPRARNPERQAKAFVHDYHSVERVAHFKALPCVGCALFGPIADCRFDGKSDNAHTGKRPGAGLKAHHSTIAPLGRKHHQLFDDHDAPFDALTARMLVYDAAAAEHVLWLSQGDAA